MSFIAFLHESNISKISSLLPNQKTRLFTSNELQATKFLNSVQNDLGYDLYQQYLDKKAWALLQHNYRIVVTTYYRDEDSSEKTDDITAECLLNAWAELENVNLNDEEEIRHFSIGNKSVEELKDDMVFVYDMGFEDEDYDFEEVWDIYKDGVQIYRTGQKQTASLRFEAFSPDSLDQDGGIPFIYDPRDATFDSVATGQTHYEVYTKPDGPFNNRINDYDKLFHGRVSNSKDKVAFWHPLVTDHTLDIIKEILELLIEKGMLLSNAKAYFDNFDKAFSVQKVMNEATTTASLKLSNETYFDSTPSEEVVMEDRNFTNPLSEEKLRRVNPKRHEVRRDWYNDPMSEESQGYQNRADEVIARLEGVEWEINKYIKMGLSKTASINNDTFINKLKERYDLMEKIAWKTKPKSRMSPHGIIYELLSLFFEDPKGNWVRRSEITERGYDYHYFQYLLDKKYVERIERGLYKATEKGVETYHDVQLGLDLESSLKLNAWQMTKLFKVSLIRDNGIESFSYDEPVEAVDEEEAIKKIIKEKYLRRDPSFVRLVDYGGYKLVAKEIKKASENEQVVITYEGFPQDVKEFVEDYFKDIIEKYPDLKEHLKSVKIIKAERPEHYPKTTGAEYDTGDNAISAYIDIAEIFGKLRQGLVHELTHAVQVFLDGREEGIPALPKELDDKYYSGDLHFYWKNPLEEHAYKVEKEFKKKHVHASLCLNWRDLPSEEQPALFGKDQYWINKDDMWKILAEAGNFEDIDHPRLQTLIEKIRHDEGFAFDDPDYDEDIVDFYTKDPQDLDAVEQWKEYGRIVGVTLRYEKDDSSLQLDWANVEEDRILLDFVQVYDHVSSYADYEEFSTDADTAKRVLEKDVPNIKVIADCEQEKADSWVIHTIIEVPSSEQSSIEETLKKEFSGFYGIVPVTNLDEFINSGWEFVKRYDTGTIASLQLNWAMRTFQAGDIITAAELAENLQPDSVWGEISSAEYRKGEITWYLWLGTNVSIESQDENGIVFKNAGHRTTPSFERFLYAYPSVDNGAVLSTNQKLKFIRYIDENEMKTSSLKLDWKIIPSLKNIEIGDIVDVVKELDDWNYSGYKGNSFTVIDINAETEEIGLINITQTISEHPIMWVPIKKVKLLMKKQASLKLGSSYDEYTERNKTLFEDRYENYGDDGGKLFWSSSFGQRKRFEALLGFTENPKQAVENMTVLDIGCGYADFISFIKEKFDTEKINYTGTELVQQMIDVATQKHPNAKFELRDIVKQPYPDNSFDLVIGSGLFAFNHQQWSEFVLQLVNSMYKTAKDVVAVNFLQNHETDDNFKYTTPKEVYAILSKITKDLKIERGYLPDDFTVYLYKNLNNLRLDWAMPQEFKVGDEVIDGLRDKYRVTGVYSDGYIQLEDIFPSGRQEDAYFLSPSQIEEYKVVKIQKD